MNPQPNYNKGLAVVIIIPVVVFDWYIATGIVVALVRGEPNGGYKAYAI